MNLSTRYTKMIFRYSAEQIFDVVNTVAEYPQFVPWCKNVKTKKISSNAFEYELSIGFPPLQEHYTSRVTSFYPNVVHVSIIICIYFILIKFQSVCKDGRLFHLLDTTWRFGPNPLKTDDSKSCCIYFSLEFEFKSTFNAQLSHIFFGQVVRKMVSAFLSRAGRLYGPSSIDPIHSIPHILSYED